MYLRCVSSGTLFDAEAIPFSEGPSIVGITGELSDAKLDARASEESANDSSSIRQHIPQNSPMRSETDLWLVISATRADAEGRRLRSGRSICSIHANGILSGSCACDSLSCVIHLEIALGLAQKDLAWDPLLSKKAVMSSSE